MLAHTQILANGGEMDSAMNINADLQRTDVYQRATDAASAERRAIQAEIANLEARVVVLQARDALLSALLRALRELLPEAEKPMSTYVPNHAIDTVAPGLQLRRGADDEIRYRARSETS